MISPYLFSRRLIGGHLETDLTPKMRGHRINLSSTICQAFQLGVYFWTLGKIAYFGGKDEVERL